MVYEPVLRWEVPRRRARPRRGSLRRAPKVDTAARLREAMTHGFKGRPSKTGTHSSRHCLMCQNSGCRSRRGAPGSATPQNRHEARKGYAGPLEVIVWAPQLESGVEVAWAASNRLVEQRGMFPRLTPGSSLPQTESLSATEQSALLNAIIAGGVLANINDGGPWATGGSQPTCGAAEISSRP
jgi:hypothetical protein